jgi:DNA sulfur modification protein DndD
MNGNTKVTIHAVSSMERHDILRWTETALNHVPSELQEHSTKLKTLESERDKIEGYIFGAPSDDTLKPLFEKLGQLHEELGMLQQQYTTLTKEADTLRYQLTLVEREQTNILNKKSQYDKVNERLKLAARTQDVLEEYLQRLRDEKVNEFRGNFLECFNFLFGKKGFIQSVNVDATNFDITLLTSRGVLIPKAELSAGERQIYAMALIWALARTSGRQMPFIIDTPLGRLDAEHRGNIMKSFLPNASNQVIVFSTNTEVDQYHFDQLQPYISKSYNLEYNPDKGETKVREGYFWKA